MTLDKRVLQEVEALYRKLKGEGRMLPESRLSSYYENFRKRFNPDKLTDLKDADLVEAMHSHANKESLVYWLEFKSDKEEFDTTRLGNIRGGSALKFGIFRAASSDAWMGKGPKGLPVEIPLEQAIHTAEEHRRQLTRGCELLEALPEGANDDDYKELQEKMDAEVPDVSRRVWGHKYFSLLYPGKLDDYHNPHYQRYHLIKLLQTPPGGNGRYVAAGYYVRTADELGVPMANLTQTLNDRDGDPHRYWRVVANYPSYGQDWMNWPAMRDGGFVAIGWANLGDLSGITHNQAGKDKLRSLMKSHYNESGRWTNEIYDFVTGINSGDLVLAFQTSTVLGVGKVTGPYYYYPSSKAPHHRTVQWLSSMQWELPEPEAQGSAVREIKDYENLVAVEKMIIDGHAETRNGEVPVRNVLNTILYGPPGTGKTYSVQHKAVRILDPEAADDWINDLYQKYRAQGRIEFVTFHPSYSYEEFVEGFRYDEDAKIPIRKDGIFKLLADRASNPRSSPTPTEETRIWKVSLGGSSEQHIFQRCMENDEIAVGWLGDDNLEEQGKEGIAELFAKYGQGESTNSINAVNYLVNEIRDGDYVAVLKNQREIRAIGVVTGPYRYRQDEYGSEYPHTRPVEWLDTEDHEIYEMNDGVNLTLATIYPLDRIPLQQFVTLLPEEESGDEPYVLIIDEINRGNISRIFGELITLIEEDKRRGAENEMTARLPYSREDFAVPKHLYLIGTMNTADRSIALLDVALRRRFEFEEMMPDVGVVREALTASTRADPETDFGEDEVQTVCEVFEELNRRMRVLLDRDHQVGHSYFMSAGSSDKLHTVIYRKVFPLLQEYFYNDQRRLKLLLGIYNGAIPRGFVESLDSEYRQVYGEDPLEDEAPWEFHFYPEDELLGALRNTFLTSG